MRRALKLLLVASILACVAAGATGLHALSMLRSASAGPAAGDALSGASRIVHAVTGHLAAILACLTAAVAFVLGLQGLLEAGGRRFPSALLFLLAPAVTWLALATEFSGRLDEDALSAGFLASEVNRAARQHAMMMGGGLAASLLATAAVATWLLWKRGGSTA